MNAAASITITPILVADLLAEGERVPVYVHIIDHPDARVLVDTGMTELHAAGPTLIPASIHCAVRSLFAYLTQILQIAMSGADARGTNGRVRLMIGIGESLTALPLPHHLAYGSVPRRFDRVERQRAI
jgi:hypothetical protein